MDQGTRGIGTHVNWVHTKFMLVDPLGDTPVVVTGSANRSLSSINANDENLVVIKGTKRAAAHLRPLPLS